MDDSAANVVPPAFDRVEQAIEDIRAGKVIIVVDDEDRENEGDFTAAAEKVTPELINFMARHGRGLICLPMTGERLDDLQIPMMVDENTSRFGTAFTVSIEARQGVTTGISAADRATTILTAIRATSRPADLVRPGHVFPLRARPGGVLERAGQTEAAVDLARLAGLYPAGVVCEIMNEDGTMARAPELRAVAHAHGLTMITVADLISFRLRTETLVRRVQEACIQTRFGEFRVHVFENLLDGEHHLALVKGSVDPGFPVLVRVQCQSTLGDVFDAAGHEGGECLRAALRRMEDAGQGILVYLRKEGRGAALASEVRAHAAELPDGTAGSPDPRADLRLHGIGAQILRELGARRITVLTDHPRRLSGLHGFGLMVAEQVPLLRAGIETGGIHEERCTCR
jgi:3,4-dihydroxy 2-butanone 4-phosphate synthase/GTP cyclohydrolase II